VSDKREERFLVGKSSKFALAGIGDLPKCYIYATLNSEFIHIITWRRENSKRVNS